MSNFNSLTKPIGVVVILDHAHRDNDGVVSLQMIYRERIEFINLMKDEDNDDILIVSQREFADVKVWGDREELLDIYDSIWGEPQSLVWLRDTDGEWVRQ